MAITFHPKPGMILMCDFTGGFREPEMVKSRPVVVISPAMTGRSNLVTVIALSSSPPERVMPYNLKLPQSSLPNLGFFQKNETWVKGDMVYSVGFHRLDLIRLNERDGRTGKRLYYQTRLGRENMKLVYGCLLASLNLQHLTEHL